MAVYAATVTLDTPKPGRLGNSPMGVLSGGVDLTNYNTTLAEATVITKAFLPNGKLRVVPNGVSSLGYAIKWDTASKSFKAFRTGATVSAVTIPTAIGNPATHPIGSNGTTGLLADAVYAIAGTALGTSLAMAEAATDTNIGTFSFIAVGQLG